MSEKAQIDVRQGNKIVVRIFSNWGTPDVVLSALRAAAKTRHSEPLAIGHEVLRQVLRELRGTGYDSHIIGENYNPKGLNFRYIVNVSSKPWRVRQTKMPGYKVLDNGDIASKLSPAVTRNIRIAA
jgi:hypothetical protein